MLTFSDYNYKVELVIHNVQFLPSFKTLSTQYRKDSPNYDGLGLSIHLATKTGHGSEDNLWHYIDLTWIELDVWGGVDRALERLRATDLLFKQLLDLQSSATDVSSNDVVVALRNILSDG